MYSDRNPKSRYNFLTVCFKFVHGLYSIHDKVAWFLFLRAELDSWQGYLSTAKFLTSSGDWYRCETKLLGGAKGQHGSVSWITCRGLIPKSRNFSLCKSHHTSGLPRNLGWFLRCMTLWCFSYRIQQHWRVYPTLYAPTFFASIYFDLHILDS